MTTARELADLALQRSRDHIERSRIEIEEASGGDWKLLSDAIKLLQEEGGTPDQHVAYTLLHSAMLDILISRRGGIAARWGTRTPESRSSPGKYHRVMDRTRNIRGSPQIQADAWSTQKPQKPPRRSWWRRLFDRGVAERRHRAALTLAAL